MEPMYFYYSEAIGFECGSLAWCFCQFRATRDRGGVCGVYADEAPDGRWVVYSDRR